MKACPAFMVSVTAIFLSACQNDSQSPPSRPESPVGEVPEPGPLAPLDLIYICGNKFLATNQTRSGVQVSYRVVGSGETGSLTLPPASDEDEGFSETELETVERGVVELYQDNDLIARRRNQGLTCGPAPSFSASAASSSSSSAGEWSPPFAWNNVAVHLSLLPTGKVLSWGLSGTPQVWDPATRSFTAIPSPVEIFCAGHALLPDGRLLVTGGNNDPDRALNGIPDVTIFTPGSQSWARLTPMRFARWYPTTLTLGNGDIVILSGKDGTGVNVGQPEVWSAGATRVLTTASLALPLYPRAFLAPNGKVFVAEKSPNRYLDPTGTGSWSAGPSSRYGQRNYGAAVMYEPGKVLFAGGGYTTNTAEIIDLNSASPTWQWTGSMAFTRRHHNAVLLPTGEVLVTGGTSGTTFNDPTRPVFVAEIWNPSTGVWTGLASNVIPRVYHSTSILLPDGRVLHTGSGDAGPDQRNAELFSPPYLFGGARPVITQAPGAVRYSTSFSVQSPQAAEITKVSLIRLGSTTHAFDMNQRFQWLSFQSQAGALSISAPSNRNIAPPGHYMLFLLNGSGVPSIARIVKLGDESDPAPQPNAAPVASFTTQCDGLDCSFTDGSTDGDGTVAGWSWTFGDGTSATSQNPSHTYGAEGSYDVTLVVTDNDGASATVTNTVTVGPPPPNTAPTAAFSETCTGLSCTFTDGSSDSDGNVTGWAWDFGDGASATTQNPEHTYGVEGSYQVSLSIVDDDGAPATSNKMVTVTPPPPNSAPTAAFSQACTGLTCNFTDGSSDGDGTVTGWSWEFGDGTAAATRNPSHTYAAGGTFVVRLVATDNQGATGTTTKSVAVIAPPANGAPTAAFVVSCNALTCRFSNRSTDADGSIVAYRWTFGSSTTTTATAPNPSRTYPAAGTYTVSLRVTDDDGATNTRSQALAVTAAIKLTATGRVDATKQYVTVRWSGARGTAVNLYRNRVFIGQEANDGLYIASRALPGLSKYTFSVCELGSTTLCSNEASVTF